MHKVRGVFLILLVIMIIADGLLIYFPILSKCDSTDGQLLSSVPVQTDICILSSSSRWSGNLKCRWTNSDCLVFSNTSLLKNRSGGIAGTIAKAVCFAPFKLSKLCILQI